MRHDKTTHSSIGGRLDYGLLTGRDQHRPQTRDEMKIAVRELAARGMTDHTIAHVTRLSVEQVRRLLGEATA